LQLVQPLVGNVGFNGGHFASRFLVIGKIGQGTDIAGMLMGVIFYLTNLLHLNCKSVLLETGQGILLDTSHLLHIVQYLTMPIIFGLTS
jgi:hypothetical protein